jgi:phosphate transport system substrate-binding protein
MNNRNFSKAVEAVSPVVATLLLVLVAAGAAIGFGVFLNGFQKKTQENVSSETPAETLKIGGSSTVWELTEKALPAWNAAHPSIQIDNQEGGSGAGKIAICKGIVDIGAESSPFAASGSQPSLTTCPDLNGDGIKDAGEGIKVFKVGFDGVAMAYKAGSCVTDATHGFSQAQVQALYNRNGAGQSVAYPAVGAGTAIGAAATPLTWGDLVTAGTCVSVANAGNTVVLGSRSDPGGTEDGFCKRVLNYEKDGTHCSNDALDQLVDSFYTAVNPQVGNDGIRSWLTANADRLSFIGFGSVAESGSGLAAASLGSGAAPTAFVAPGTSSIKTAGNDATLPGTCASAAPTGEYCATRALEYMTGGTPSASEQLFLDFMLSTLNNQNFNKAAGYVSLY